MKICLVVLAACGLLLAGCGEDRSGSSAMYELIETSTDCDWLAATMMHNFNKSESLDSAEIGYAEAAAEQRELIGC